MKIKWQQKIPDTEVLLAAKLPSIYTKSVGQVMFVECQMSAYQNDWCMENSAQASGLKVAKGKDSRTLSRFLCGPSTQIYNHGKWLPKIVPLGEVTSVKELQKLKRTAKWPRKKNAVGARNGYPWQLLTQLILACLDRNHSASVLDLWATSGSIRTNRRGC